MTESKDFSTFLSALRKFRRDEGTVRPTAHTSSVSTADWKRVEQALTNKA
jgi:hypothetical protein